MKVLIGCPTYFKYEYCLDQYIAAVKSLQFKDYDLVLVDNSQGNEYLEKIKSRGIQAIKGSYVESAKDRIVLSRELLIKKCLEEGYDYFFSLEQDVLVQPDTLTRLLKHKLPIVSCYYGNNMPMRVKNKKTGEERKVLINVPLIWMQTKPGFIKRANASDLVHKGLVEVGAAGVGCMLIAREVLEKTGFRKNPGRGFDDATFCNDAKKAGYKIMVDGDIILKHLHTNWTAMGVTK